jgi:plasmid stabilization system protein ParE
MSSQYSDQPSGWRRFWNRIFPPRPRPTPSSAVPAEPVYYRPTQPGKPIVALSRGEVYEFQIFADLEWSSDAMRYSELTRKAEEYTASAGDDLRRRVWQTARRFGPHEAAKTEAELRSTLGNWCYDTDAGRVREHLTPYVLREITADSEAALSRQRIALVREFVASWSILLTELGVSPVKLAAAAMTDGGFATMLGQLAERRRLSAKELVDVLGQASNDHEQLGMYEFAELYATAVAAYRRQMEVEDSKFIEQVMDIEPTGSSR